MLRQMTTWCGWPSERYSFLGANLSETAVVQRELQACQKSTTSD